MTSVATAPAVSDDVPVTSGGAINMGQAYDIIRREDKVQEPEDRKMRIAIVAAMESELVHIRKKLIDEQLVEEVSGISFYRGKLAGHDIILLRSGIGKVNAALTVGILCDKYHPHLIINTGCAGGLGDDDAPGDLIVATECTYGDVNATFFGYANGQVPGMPKSYLADTKIISLLRECFNKNNNFIDQQQDSSPSTATSIPSIPESSSSSAANDNSSKQRVRFGLLLTTDSFISENERRLQLKKEFSQGLAVDMEGCAMAQVAYRYQIPFVALRALSDTANDEASENYKEFLDLSVRRATDGLMSLLEKLNNDNDAIQC